MTKPKILILGDLPPGEMEALRNAGMIPYKPSQMHIKEITSEERPPEIQIQMEKSQQKGPEQGHRKVGKQKKY